MRMSGPLMNFGDRPRELIVVDCCVGFQVVEELFESDWLGASFAGSAEADACHERRTVGAALPAEEPSPTVRALVHGVGRRGLLAGMPGW